MTMENIGNSKFTEENVMGCSKENQYKKIFSFVYIQFLIEIWTSG